MLSPQEVCFIVTSRRNSPFDKQVFCLIFFQFTSAKLFWHARLLQRTGYGYFPLIVQSIVGRYDSTLRVPPIGMIRATNNVDLLSCNGSPCALGDLLQGNAASRFLLVPGMKESVFGMVWETCFYDRTGVEVEIFFFNPE